MNFLALFDQQSLTNDYIHAALAVVLFLTVVLIVIRIFAKAPKNAFVKVNEVLLFIAAAGLGAYGALFKKCDLCNVITIVILALFVAYFYGSLLAIPPKKYRKPVQQVVVNTAPVAVENKPVEAASPVEEAAVVEEVKPVEKVVKTNKKEFNKVSIMKFLDKKFGKDVISKHSEENFMVRKDGKQGLAIPDTHYSKYMTINGRLVKSSKGACFAFVYEDDDKVTLILKTSPEHFEAIKKAHPSAVESTFPRASKSAEKWYACVLDETYKFADLKDMLVKSFNIVKKSNKITIENDNI